MKNESWYVTWQMALSGAARKCRVGNALVKLLDHSGATD